MILHVACLPFPSPQGTQAALASMLRASAQAGRETHLLTYAHGAHSVDTPYRVHRLLDLPRVRSLRSGPSWGKLLLDAQAVLAIRRLARRLRPEAIVAHHVEAALSATAAGVGPIYYFAHTTLEQELGVYFPRALGPAMSAIGYLLDRASCLRVRGVGAVSPSLAKRVDERARYLPVPWPPIGETAEQEAARDALGLRKEAKLCLYAGNLDRYQGWEDLIEALRLLRQTEPKTRLLIASESDPSKARRTAMRLGVGATVDFRRLDDERARSLVHAASDVAWIPRRTVGGLPIKMLDAFGRGLPVVATERATAGLPILDVCCVVPNEAPQALAEATERLLQDSESRARLREQGLDYLKSRHSDRAYLAALDALIEGHTARAASASCTGTPSPLSSSASHHRNSSCSSVRTTSPRR